MNLMDEDFQNNDRILQEMMTQKFAIPRIDPERVLEKLIQPWQSIGRFTRQCASVSNGSLSQQEIEIGTPKKHRHHHHYRSHNESFEWKNFPLSWRVSPRFKPRFCEILFPELWAL
jgi:hypothetical protein